MANLTQQFYLRELEISIPIGTKPVTLFAYYLRYFWKTISVPDWMDKIIIGSLQAQFPTSSIRDKSIIITTDVDRNTQWNLIQQKQYSPCQFVVCGSVDILNANNQIAFQFPLSQMLFILHSDQLQTLTNIPIAPPQSHHIVPESEYIQNKIANHTILGAEWLPRIV